ncbi:outer membrane lipoprotein Blc [Alcanivorax hongdengensis A-11-3]|uniref:Outer membrane lipoprotein Blc n=1 Tax=Alcanivorax hongdengensis A-11-3 TaxID=1177179 RepID=L0WAY0_9GAMM|nr:lipocalin family protein [Alcanivorax hongdengensis]EKF73898.1 outer membrane lipoprotein Blc [Alcanivorax hongdengensis A-11-3]
MRLAPLSLVLVLPLLLSACGGQDQAPLETVKQVDLERYTGTWYEIARLPQWFQRGCYDSTATYSLNPDGSINVVNRCRKGDDNSEEAHGTATVVDGSGNAKLKVRFDNWFSRLFPTITEGNYWILALDQNYQSVVIGEPGREYLWILARQPQLSEDRYQALVSIARDKDFPVDQLKRNRNLRPSP